MGRRKDGTRHRTSAAAMARFDGRGAGNRYGRGKPPSRVSRLGARLDRIKRALARIDVNPRKISMNRISQASFSLTLILALSASPLSAQTGAFSLADYFSGHVQSSKTGAGLNADGAMTLLRLGAVSTGPAEAARARYEVVASRDTSPSDVYRLYLARVAEAERLEDLVPFLPEQFRLGVEAAPAEAREEAFTPMIAFLRTQVSSHLDILSITVNGDEATIRGRGEIIDERTGEPGPMVGTVRFIRERGTWRVKDQDWDPPAETARFEVAGAVEALVDSVHNVDSHAGSGQRWHFALEWDSLTVTISLPFGLQAGEYRLRGHREADTPNAPVAATFTKYIPREDRDSPTKNQWGVLRVGVAPVRRRTTHATGTFTIDAVVHERISGSFVFTAGAGGSSNDTVTIRGAFQHIKIPDAGTNEFEFELELSEPVEEQEPPI